MTRRWRAGDSVRVYSTQGLLISDAGIVGTVIGYETPPYGYRGDIAVALDQRYASRVPEDSPTARDAASLVEAVHPFPAGWRGTWVFCSETEVDPEPLAPAGGGV